MATDTSLQEPTSKSTLVHKPGTTSKLWEYFELRNNSDGKVIETR